MIFFKRKSKILDSKMTNFKDFTFTSYLSPWYFTDDSPKIGQNLKWKYSDKLWITKLLSKKACLGLVDGYCYIKPLNSEEFLIWERGTTKIEFYKTKDLKPIPNMVDIIKILRDTKRKFYFNCKPVDQIEYYFDLYQTEINFEFPESLKNTEEIIQVNDISGMYKDLKTPMGNTAVVVLQPKSNRIFLYPQDWFNRDNQIDFGYQWITRADRHPKTGKIHIQGIRIDEYILDETNRQILK
jgi:hypothetical protein